MSARQIKNYDMGLTAILFSLVIGDLYNNPKQTKHYWIEALVMAMSNYQFEFLSNLYPNEDFACFDEEQLEGIFEAEVLNLSWQQNEREDSAIQTPEEKIKVAGEIFSQSEYDNIANITEQDVREAIEDWKESAPEKYKDILEAE